MITTFDKLNQLWVEKEIKDLKIGDLVKQDNEQISVIDRIDTDTNNTIIVYLKPYTEGE
jgi:predicted lipid carrier protein YhbT